MRLPNHIIGLLAFGAVLLAVVWHLASVAPTGSLVATSPDRAALVGGTNGTREQVWVSADHDGRDP